MFFEAQGFTSKGLAEDGLFGKEDYEDGGPWLPTKWVAFLSVFPLKTQRAGTL